MPFHARDEGRTFDSPWNALGQGMLTRKNPQSLFDQKWWDTVSSFYRPASQPEWQESQTYSGSAPESSTYYHSRPSSDEPYASVSPPPPPSPWTTLGQDIVRGVVPSLAAGGVAAGLQGLFGESRGTPDKSQLLVTDVRTPEMLQAEKSRLAGVSRAEQDLGRAMSNPLYGTLSAEMQAADIEEIKRQRRNADAARGMLETGGSAGREMEDIRKYRRDRESERIGEIEKLRGQVGSLTSGFQSLAPSVLSVGGTPPQQSPWARIAMGGLVPGVYEGMRTNAQRWWETPDERRRRESGR